MKTFAGVLIMVFALPGLARADCRESSAPATPAPSDPLSDRPYAEDAQPRKPCPETDIDLSEPATPPVRGMAIGGLGAGAGLLAIGGVLWLVAALTADPGTQRAELGAAIGFGAVGGALFLTGVGLVVYDMASAPPQPRTGRGLALSFSGRF